MGAIASGGICVLNDEVVRYLRVPDEIIRAAVAEQRRELDRRERAYRGNLPPVDVRGRTVILIDDGVATGATMQVAALDAHTGGAAGVIICPAHGTTPRQIDELTSAGVPVVLAMRTI